MKPKRLLTIGIPVVLIAGIGTGAFFYFTPRHTPTEALLYDVGGFSGIVVNGMTNEPVKGAHVLARHQQTQDTQEVTTDDRGRFALDLEDGTWNLTATKDLFLPQGMDDKGREMTIQNGTKFVNAKLKIWPAAQIHGRVLAGNVGITANISAVYLHDASGAEDYSFEKITTQDDGTFTITNAYAGVMNISIAADGFANVTLKDVNISAGQNLDLGDIPMQDGVSLFGIITDAATKKGIPGAAILIKNQTGKTLETTHSENNGEYRLPPIDMKQLEISISAEGYHDFSRRMRLEGNANRELNLALIRAWGLSLDVQNQTGREPIETHITITDVNTQKIVYDETVSNGVFSLDTLKGGPFLIAAESFDKQTHQTLRTQAGESVRIRLKPFAKIIGSARDSDGSKLTKGQYRYSYKEEANGDESFMPWNSLTSADFEIAELPSGIYRVMIKKNGDDKEISSPEFILKDGDIRNVTLQMTEGGVLKGHVISSNEGYNIRATVSIEELNRSTQTDVDGYFTFDKLPNHAVTLIIKPDREDEETRFTGIVVKEDNTVERDFRVTATKIERREKRREQIREMRERGERPTPPWGDGKPPWGDGPPPWANGDGKPPWGDGKPPWGDGPPPWENGEGKPPWGDGKPPWGDGPPPWENGEGKPPWGDWQPQTEETNQPDNAVQPSDAPQPSQNSDNSGDNATRRTPRNIK